MFVIDTDAALSRALDRLPDQHLRPILADCARQLGGTIVEAARFIIVERDDPFGDVEAAISFPLTIDGAPTWEIARCHPGGWVEVVFVLSDDGPADVLLVPTRDRIDPRLTSLLRRHGALATDPERHTAA